MAIIFLAKILAEEKPSENIMISAMSVKSGTIMDTGRRMACRNNVMSGVNEMDTGRRIASKQAPCDEWVQR